MMKGSGVAIAAGDALAGRDYILMINHWAARDQTWRIRDEITCLTVANLISHSASDSVTETGKHGTAMDF
jgi:hypothetical protein